MPVIFSRKTDSGGVAAVWKIDETEEQLLQMFPCTKQMLLNVQSFRYAPRRLEWMASRALIYKLTQHIPHVIYNENGQPFVAQLNKSISITHTKGFAAIAISQNDIAGIDIEIPQQRILRIAERFLHPDEKLFIPPDKELEYDTLIWCAKEVLYKMIRRQDAVFNADLKVSPFALCHEGILNTEELGVRATHYQLNYITDSDYTLVWHC
ncbi:MAG: 4'-phosphopantetheinyl transferase superfamily protein [Cytophagaceae bacterium]|jgi:4'-phosphopantetheinyl transferase EntD|nr:4'-phosphopantetheinyl transferase superfamily protein [Cytophagaceae bacterium]